MKLNKRLGQYILQDQSVVERIVESLDLEPTDTVLEVGPGTGALTTQLAENVKLFLAVEKDYRMVEILRAKLKSKKEKVKIIHEDILKFDESGIEGLYKLVGNLPYNITSPILRKFLESAHKPSVMIVMVQKEVAQRITAKPGDSNRGILTLMIEYFGDAEILLEVPRDRFVPVPKVDSAVVKIVPHSQLSSVNGQVFFRVVKAGFSAKRRQIHNSLKGGLGLSSEAIHDMLKESKVDSVLRAEDLTLEQWQKLAEWIKKFSRKS